MNRKCYLLAEDKALEVDETTFLSVKEIFDSRERLVVFVQDASGRMHLINIPAQAPMFSQCIVCRTMAGMHQEGEHHIYFPSASGHYHIRTASDSEYASM